MSIPFVHLHCHSYYSLLDGTGSIGDLLQRAKELEMPALALTDNGNLYEALEFYRKAESMGIKPIIGCEAYVATESRFDKNDSYDRLTLLAMNQEGYHHLIRLSSLAFLEGFYHKPKIDKGLLQQLSEGLVCLSGGISSELSRSILKSDGKAKEIAGWYQDVFGDRYYLEIQNHGLESQKIILQGMVEIAGELGIPTVATNDVHYLNQEDCGAHELLRCIETGGTLADKKTSWMENNQFFFRSETEMLQALPGYEDAIQRTMEITDRCHLELDGWKMPYRFVPVFIPPKEMSADDYLKKLCFDGLKKRYADNPKRYKDGTFSTEVSDRLNKELNVIKELGCANYFLIVWDFVRFAAEQNIYHTARGSAVGALVCFALNISHECPLDFDLLFERFLDPSRPRAQAPDIDIDFDQERYHEILNYGKEKYGKDSVVQTCLFESITAKRAIRNAGWGLGMPMQFVEDIAEQFSEDREPTFSSWGRGKISEFCDKYEGLRERYENESEVKELLDYAKQIEGLPYSPNVHVPSDDLYYYASSFVIADVPLVEHIPLQMIKDHLNPVTQWDTCDIQRAGFFNVGLFWVAAFGGTCMHH
ncbi:hypothetical protein FACS189443_3980 [Planctomycetales bacterium]|nr:hypothetical protein FACS189443_3980 [Planctomycetales bacterium]